MAMILAPFHRLSLLLSTPRLPVFIFAAFPGRFSLSFLAPSATSSQPLTASPLHFRTPSTTSQHPFHRLSSPLPLPLPGPRPPPVTTAPLQVPVYNGDKYVQLQIIDGLNRWGLPHQRDGRASGFDRVSSSL